MKAVLITGGRDYLNYKVVSSVLDQLHPSFIITGGATGADAMAERWAAFHGVHAFVCAALWDAYGRRAGYIRNSALIAVAKRLSATVVAFPGGRGTADCVRRAKAIPLLVRVVKD